MNDEPLIEVTLPGSVDEVWPHLRDPELIRRWFGWEYDGFEAEIEVIFLNEREGLEVDDEAHTITWGYGGTDQDRFELRPDGGDQCVLRVTRTISPESWDGVFDPMAEGWISFVQQLRFALERHPGEERRTVFLSSPVTETDDAMAVIGVDRIDGPWVGMLGPDAGRSGDLWFRTQHQVGVTVDQYGRALLLVATSPGGVMATLSLYGDATAEVADLTTRWRGWWADHVGPPSEEPVH